MKKAFSLIELSIVILIIGILVAGVTQGSRLVAQMRLASARAQTQSSPINSISGLTLWLETTAEKSLLDAEEEDGALLSSWSSINPRVDTINFVQTGGSIYQPFYKSSGMNGLPVVSFSGARAFNNSTLKIGDLVGLNQASLFLVMRVDAINSTPLSWVSGSYRFSIHAPYTDSKIHFDFGTCCTAASRLSYTVPASFYASAQQVLTTVKKSNGDAYLKLNGTQVAAVSATMTDSLDLNQSGWLIIGDFSGGGSAFDGYIAEIVVFNRALKTDEVRDVEQYLSKKWGIKVS